MNAVVYWEISGQILRKSIVLIGAIIIAEYYDPSVPPGSMIYWRAVAVDDDGNKARSAAQSFAI